MKRKKNKKITQEEINKLYDEFWNIYNSLPNNNFKIRNRFMDKIVNKHYKKNTLTRLIVGIKWFTSNYNLNKFYCTFEYLGNSIPFIDIYEINGDKYPIYEYKVVRDKIILVNDFMALQTYNIKL